MEVKRNVRQRRMDRLKELREPNERSERHMKFPVHEPQLFYDYRTVPGALQEEQADGKNERGGMPAGYDQGQRDGRPPGRMEPPLALDKFDDPEFVWKQKWERDLTGYGSYYRDRDRGGQGSGPPRSGTGRLRIHIVISALLFAATWGIFQLDQPWAAASQEQIRSALTRSIDFGKAAAWYEQKFGGTPTLLPAIQSLGGEAQKVTADITKHYFVPVQGKLAAPFDSKKMGITISVKADSPVFAIDTGRVIFSGVKEETGHTVIIQHADGIQSTYGYLTQPRVTVNDWVKGGETVGNAGVDGKTAGGKLFFAVWKGNAYINPADVVTIEP
jgi:stage IV sporulation protein FA